MKALTHIALAVAALSVSACATTSTAETQREAAQRMAQDEDDPIICRREREIGTRITSRVCHPSSVWARMREEAERVGRNADITGQTVDVFDPAGPGR